MLRFFSDMILFIKSNDGGLYGTNQRSIERIRCTKTYLENGHIGPCLGGSWSNAENAGKGIRLAAKRKSSYICATAHIIKERENLDRVERDIVDHSENH